jgi:Na+/H+ antiporter NhaD/arsenite permease-like protein
MLLLAFAPWPYGYYQLLRFVVFGVSIYTAFNAYKWKKTWEVWLLGVIALLFNPLIPVHLSREIWQVIDFICAILIIIIGFLLKKPDNTSGYASE